jgi:hypothetical protein
MRVHRQSEPLLTADDDIEDDDDEESSDEEEPVFVSPPFKYDHGFNALAFLGRYLHKHHPRNIARRIAERQNSFQYLCKRAVRPPSSCRRRCCQGCHLHHPIRHIFCRRMASGR